MFPLMYVRHLSISSSMSAGSGDVKSICLPVVGWTKPSVRACRAWRGACPEAVFYELLVAAGTVAAQYFHASITLVGETADGLCGACAPLSGGCAPFRGCIPQASHTRSVPSRGNGSRRVCPCLSLVGTPPCACVLSGSRPMLPSMRPSSSVKLPHTKAL